MLGKISLNETESIGSYYLVVIEMMVDYHIFKVYSTIPKRLEVPNCIIA